MNTFSPRGNIFGPILPLFVLRSSISLGAKVTYSLLCNCAAEKDHCWPSHAKLAEWLSCSVSSVKNYLRELEHVELILTKREHYRSSTYYMLNPEHSKIPYSVQSKPIKQQTNSEGTQSNFENTGANFDYINNLNNKKNKKTHPLPPTGLETNQSSFLTMKTSVGGVYSFAHNFQEVWDAYPKKEGKGLARMAFIKLHQQGLLPSQDILLQTIERFIASDIWQKENGRFIPQMSNWLRGERWLDEPSLHEKKAQEEKEKIRLKQKKRQAQEAEIRKAEDAKKEMLRPLFDAFVAKFSPPANMAMILGIWMCLHSRNMAPLAHDVPAHCTKDIMAFMREHQRQQEEALYKQNHANRYQMPIAQPAIITLQEAV